MKTKFLHDELLLNPENNQYYINNFDLVGTLCFLNEIFGALKYHGCLENTQVQRLCEDAIKILNRDYNIVDNPVREYDKTSHKTIDHCFVSDEYSNWNNLYHQEDFFIIIDEMCYMLNVLYNEFENIYIADRAKVKRDIAYMKEFIS